MTIVNTHIMQAIANQRIADLHRDAAPRAEATPKPRRARRSKRPATTTQTAQTVRADQR